MTQNKTTNILSNPFKELSIQVSLSGLSFCILDGANNQIDLLDIISFEKKATPENLIQHLENWFSKENIKELAFHKVSVIHENDLSTFVPKSLFNESNLSNYLKYNIKILENDFISFDELKEHDLYNVYVPFANVNNYIFDKFGDFEYKHFSTILIETLINTAKKSDEQTLYAYISKNHFEITVLDQKKLVLYNTYQYQQKEDFIYHLLFVIEQLNLNPEETPTYLLGDISEDSELHKIAYQYIRHVEISNCFYPKKIKETTEPTIKNSNTFILLNSL
ncbi:hypothetical protein JoomaDRAFT_0109 [Galbibacter orientalis DSM 19592]|uniref:DUF3822 domain-containing protein n=1 Tax=Galbibacter orientalis DSM 19592 TaxID=926559 RepID=I3C0M6_9FLAO|nr:DUF3822 family protein [Galbibacter orientalis]EIJ37169.1 hypothetical protein JoomaDRAFT_0109 [Galbibacter orientalis DSM 19592]